MKKLSRLTLRKVDVDQSDILQKRELKYIIGGYDGSGYDGSGYDGSGSNATFSCYLDGPNGLHQTSCWNLSLAFAYCDAWTTMGYSCKCAVCY